MNDAYRAAAPPKEPWTDGEVSFWESVYLAKITKGYVPEDARNDATQAMADRRKSVGVR